MTSSARAARVFVRSSPSPRSLERDGHDSLFPHLEHPRSSRHHPQRDPLGEPPPLPRVPGRRPPRRRPPRRDRSDAPTPTPPRNEPRLPPPPRSRARPVSRAYASSRDTFSPAFAAFSSPCFFPSSARRPNRFRNDTATRTRFASSSASDAANARATAAVSAVSSGRHVICTGMIFRPIRGPRSPARTAFRERRRLGARRRRRAARAEAGRAAAFAATSARRRSATGEGRVA